MNEIIRLVEKPTKESVSALITTPLESSSHIARGYYDKDKESIIIGSGKINLLFNEDPDYYDVIDLIRGFYHLKPVFGLRTPHYNFETRHLER